VTKPDAQEPFFDYADAAGENVFSRIQLVSDVPDFSTSVESEVDVLQEVEKGWILYIKVVGRSKGSYALRKLSPEVVVPLTIVQLCRNYHGELLLLARTANRVMTRALINS
jgi:hypothetical protein